MMNQMGICLVQLLFSLFFLFKFLILYIYIYIYTEDLLKNTLLAFLSELWGLLSCQICGRRTQGCNEICDSNSVSVSSLPTKLTLHKWWMKMLVLRKYIFEWCF